jgi:hypothetical protein
VASSWVISGIEGALDGLRGEGARVQAVDPVRAQHDERVEVCQVLDHDRGPVRDAEVDPADDRLAALGSPDAIGEQVCPGERPRHQPATQLGEDQHGVGEAEADASLRLGQPQAEHAHLGELAPERPIEGVLLFELAQRLDGNPPLAEGTDAVAQRLLVFGELEVHQRGSRGSRRMRSEMMLRWIWEEPAAIVSDRD